MNKSTVKQLLQKYHIRPNKLLGQNFLTDPNVLKKIIQSADLNKKDTVLEIGPGLGVLTRGLAQYAKKVIAIEKDKNLVGILKQELKNHKNIQIIQGDALKITAYSLGLTGYKIVANLPYYLSSPLIRKLLQADRTPEQMVLMLQKEVAQRIAVKPPKMAYLSVFVQFYGQPEIISYVSKSCFFPRPEVDSAILKISPIKKPTSINSKKLFEIVKAGFSSPRKQLANNLSQKLKINKAKIKAALKKCHINEQARPGNLSVKNWLCLQTLARL